MTTGADKSSRPQPLAAGGATGASAFRAFGSACLLGLVLHLAACGNGGSDPSATALPSQVSLAVPQGPQQSGNAISFNAGVADPAQKLRYAWQFGDGNSSTQAAPSHAFALPGHYTVQLTITNEAGETRSAQASVVVADLALAQGLVCSSSVASSSSTGWCWQRPAPQGNGINNLQILASGSGWAVGDSGTLMATTDGGAQWAAQAAPSTQDLSLLAAVDAQVAWAASARGELLTTTDGGRQWRSVAIPGNPALTGLGARSASSAWVLTSTGTRLLSSDGGANWAPTPPPADLAGSVLSTPDGGVWVIPTYATLGPGFSAGMQWARSANSGTSWTTGAMPALVSGRSRNVWSAQAVSATVAMMVLTDAGPDPKTDLIVRSTQAWRTVDGGRTWQNFNRAPFDDASLVVNYQMSSANTLLAQVPDARLFHSNDGGSTWAAVPLPAGVGAGAPFKRAQLLGDANEAGPARIALTAADGRLFITKDAGARWAETSPGGGPWLAGLTGVWFFDRREGLVTLGDGSSLRSSDGGRSWAAAASTGAVASTWGKLRFVPGSDTGWVIAGGQSVWRSTDRGRNWAAPSAAGSAPLAGVSDFQFVDAQRGWAVTRDSTAAGSVFRSSDGGQSWQGMAGTGALRGLEAVQFAPDGRNGVAAGRAGLALTSNDGGSTWSASNTGTDATLRQLVFIDSNTVLAVGDKGTVLRSTDRGRNWSRVATPTTEALTSVMFSSALRGYAVGEQGTVLASSDGGLSWSAQTPRTRVALRALHFIDDLTGWVVGDNGAVLVTVNGGN